METNTSSPARQRRPRPKPQRSARLVIRPLGRAPGILQLTVGNKADDYYLFCVPADFGDGFRLVKIGIDVPDGEGDYAVNINGGEKTCDCKGHARHGRCKHADGLAALIAAGKL
jgi:hypothetical protein